MYEYMYIYTEVIGKTFYLCLWERFLHISQFYFNGKGKIS